MGSGGGEKKIVEVFFVIGTFLFLSSGGAKVLVGAGVFWRYLHWSCFLVGSTCISASAWVLALCF